MNGQSPAPHPHRWLALALLGTAFFMVILDSTIVYVALPLIQDDLGFSTRSVQWVMSAYLLCFGGLLLLGGRTADLLGRRRVFMVGVALFGASSLICGLAWSEGVLIAARVVQGASAAIMAPTALSLLLTVFPEGADRNKALGIWGGLGGIGATAGLLIGGPVTEGLGWEWVFFINLPVALAVLGLTPRLLPESIDEDCVRCFDLAGALTVTTAVLLLVAGISEAPEAGWTDPRTLAFLGASVALLALFRRIEQRSPGPLVPLRIFRSRSLVGGNLVLLTAGICIEGMLLIVTLYAQEVLGYSTIQFGLMTAVMTVMSVIGAYSAQATVTRIGTRPVGAAGMLLIGAACVVLTQVSANGSYLDDIFLGLLIFGAGLGAAFVASQIAALSDVAERESGLAAGLVDSSFNIGGALGLAILSTVAVARTDAVAGGAGPDAGLQALTEGFQAAFLVAVGFGLLGLLAALALLPRSTAEEAPASAQPEPPTELNSGRIGMATRIVLLPLERASDGGATLARSHADYPSFRHLFPERTRRIRALQAIFTGVARDAARLGSAYSAVNDDDAVLGVAIWLPPGRFPWSAWRQLRGAGWMLGVLRADPSSFRAFMKTGANGARLHPAYPHWYLETMGVDPAAQHKGIGGRLLEPVLEIADRARVDCYLETADRANIDFYKRHGFVVETSSLELVPDGPAHVAMRRRSRLITESDRKG